MENLLAGGGLIAEHSMAITPAVLYEESVVSTGRPYEDIIFSPVSAQALSLALGRLPARDLGRLKLVCRSWRAMIESDRFAKLHNDHARTSRSSPPCFFFPVAGLEDRFLEPFPGASQPLLRHRVVSSKPCHGLLLVSYDNHSAHLINPVTKAQRDFSLPFMSRTSGGSPAMVVDGCVGLGYDQATEEHVLVHLAFVFTSRGRFDMERSVRCGVWRLKDPEPRTVPSPPPMPVTLDVPPVHVGGRMYWTGKPPPGTGAHDILAFDIRTESFDVIPAPHVDDGGGRMLVAELAGKLCAVHSCPNRETMTIWNTCDGGQRWTREHVIQLGQWREFSPRTAAGVVVPVEVDAAGDGQILLDTGRALGFYNPGMGTLETAYSLEWQFGELTEMFVAASLCEDSLVRPYDRRQPFPY